MSTSLLVRARRSDRSDGTPVDRLLPGTASADMVGDVAESLMDPAEAIKINRAVTARRLEFGTVRFCARQALRRLGFPAQPILPDPDGVPGWPAGVVGSMTHCPGYRAAVVARADAFAGIGLDAEPHQEVPAEALDLILRGPEWPQLQSLAADQPHLHWDRILFSAKEAVYKAWFPLTRSPLEFADVSVTLDPDGTFQARLPAWGPLVRGVDLSGLTGYWLVDHGLIVTATYAPAGAR